MKRLEPFFYRATSRPQKRRSRSGALLFAVALASAGTIQWPALASAAGGILVPPILLAAAGKAPTQTLAELDAGHPQDLIILFEAQSIEDEAALRRSRAGLRHDDAAILSYKAEGYRQLKEPSIRALTPDESEDLQDYSHLPMTFRRFSSRTALEKLLLRPEVAAVYPNSTIMPHLATSLPFIGEPALPGMGLAGSGSTVAVIDTGINYTLPNFGSCSTPGVPAGCKVPVSLDVTVTPAVNSLNTDPLGHGSNVAGIVAGVAPGARIIALNAFSGGSSSTAWVIAGINWAIANQAAYGITALNMSLGDSSSNASPCSNSRTNAFLTPLKNARTAGMLAVASSGNSGSTNGVASPACTPGVVSVGAVYDADWGGPYTWSGSNCTDSGSSADRITCFSNSASYLTLLAPGAFVTASGIQMAGTSQAAPHVAGALAVLRSAFPANTLDQTVARLTGSGTPVSDARNGFSTPRLNLLAALGAPVNDSLASRSPLSGDSGSVSANNANGTKEAGEPAHAGNPGGKSVWWSWTPLVSGAASLDTVGSNFTTLLAVYTGSSVGALTQVAANSGGTGSAVNFAALGGTEYLVAVDGADGAFGSITLNRQLAMQADLALTLLSPPSAPVGSDITYTASVSNLGPSAAPGVTLTAALPAGTNFVSASPGCSVASGSISCTLIDLAPNTANSLQIVLKANGPGTLDLSATVASALPDPVPGNNNASAASTVISVQIPAVPALSSWGIAAAICMLSCLLGRGRRSGRRGAGEYPA